MKKIMIVIVLACLSSAWSGRVIYPGRSASKVVKAGGVFTIGYAGAADERIHSVTLVGPYNRVTATIGGSTAGNFVYDAQSKASYTHDISVTVPAGTPIELYDVVINSSTGVWTSRKCLKVVNEFKSRYTIVHITDTHIGWGKTWDGDAAREMRYFDQVLKATEIIAPEYMVFTGDNIHNGTPQPLDLKWRNFYEGATGVRGVQGIGVPAIVSSGNHDFFSGEANAVAEWNQHCGLRSFGFSYGNTRIAVFDDYLARFSSATPDFPAQQAAQLTTFLQKEGRGSFRMAIQHSIGNVYQPFFDAQAIQYGLFGHNHANSSRRLGAATGLVTASASHYASVGIGNVGWFRVLVLNDSGVQANNAVQFGNPNALSADLQLAFANPNTGRARENAATLTNDMGIGFESCRIRFVMAKGSYQVDAGQVEQVIDNDTVSVYDVRIRAAANSRATVRIAPRPVDTRDIGPLDLGDVGFRLRADMLHGTLRADGVVTEPSAIRLELLDLEGRQVASMTPDLIGTGRMVKTWDLRGPELVGLRKGLYVARLELRPLASKAPPKMTTALLDLSHKSVRR